MSDFRWRLQKLQSARDTSFAFLTLRQQFAHSSSPIETFFASWRAMPSILIDGSLLDLHSLHAKSSRSQITIRLEFWKKSVSRVFSQHNFESWLLDKCQAWLWQRRWAISTTLASYMTKVNGFLNCAKASCFDANQSHSWSRFHFLVRILKLRFKNNDKD